MADFNETFLISLSIVAIGFILKKTHFLTEEHGKALARVIFYITLPAVILYNLPKVELNTALIMMPLICLGYNLCLFAIVRVFFKKQPTEIKGILMMTCLGFNVGNFALPLIEGVWGSIGVQYISMFDVGNALIIFILNYIIAWRHSPKFIAENTKITGKLLGLRLLRSISLLCYGIGLLLNQTQTQMPIFFDNLLAILSRSNLPLVFLTLGLFLNFKFEKSEWLNILKVIVIRYAFGFGIGLILFYTLPFTLFEREMILISLIVSIGMAIITYGAEFEYSEKGQQIIGTLTNLTLIISFFLMWLIIFIIGT